jgi:16S rRNA processing protein RimM
MRQPQIGDDGLIAVGRIVNTHGLRGELRVKLFNPESTAIHSGSEIVLRRDGNESSHRVETTRPHKRFLLVTLAGCGSIDAAEPLVGTELCVAKSELPPAGPDEIYHFDLVGMQVVTTTGEDLGEVVEVMAIDSNDVCIVRGDEGEHLIPMIADVVREIDREQRRLVIEPLPGLLE